MAHSALPVMMSIQILHVLKLGKSYTVCINVSVQDVLHCPSCPGHGHRTLVVTSRSNSLTEVHNELSKAKLSAVWSHPIVVVSGRVTSMQ